jgi:hypothetical protein
MAAFDSKRVLVLSPPAAGFPNSSNAPIDLVALALRWLTPV